MKALAQLRPRERRGVAAAAVVVGLAVLWWVLLAPALRTLRAAPSEIARLETQLAQMRQWATEAEALRQAPRRPPPTDFAGTVSQRVKRALGDKTQVVALPNEVRLITPNVPPATLLALLQDVDDSAQARVSEMTLTRNADGSLRADIKWAPRSSG